MIDFNMLVEINRILKENNLDYTIHNFSSCNDTRVYLKGEGDKEKAVILINEYLKSKFLYIDNIEGLKFNVIYKYNI